jgi:hypothetical protein
MDQGHADYAEPGELRRDRLRLWELALWIVAVLAVLAALGLAAFMAFVLYFAWSMRDFN